MLPYFTKSLWQSRKPNYLVRVQWYLAILPKKSKQWIRQSWELSLLWLVLKSKFSEKATKIWKNLPLVLTFTQWKSNQVGDFFQILWPSDNVLTLNLIQCYYYYFLIKLQINFLQFFFYQLYIKVKVILKDSLDLIPPPSPSVKIQIIGRRVRVGLLSETAKKSQPRIYISRGSEWYQTDSPN